MASPSSRYGSLRPAAEAGQPPRSRGRVPRKATEAHLENAALWYLTRFQATAQSLERVLMRRVERSARHHGTDAAAGREWVRALIARYRASGLIDDAAFARARAEALNGRGLSLRAIAAKLAEKGIPRADVDAALAMLRGNDDGDPDLAAARRRAKRRGLGPWRKEGREARREKDLAALARAGFSYGIAREVIDGERGD